MDSQNQNNFKISNQQPLLHRSNDLQQPKHKTKNKNNLENILFITFLILIVLTSISTTLFSMSKTKEPKPIELQLSNSNLHYCHLTTYSDLCYDSMFSIINTTLALKSINPNPIFSTAIQLAINQLNNITFYQTNDSLVLSECGTRVNESLRRLNESLIMIDSDIESLTYEEMDNMKTCIMNDVSNALKCSLALEEKMGVEEVKMGVEKARMFMVNSVGLLSGRESILSDFYNPVIEFDDDDHYYYEHSYYQFDYRFLVCLYSGLYLFLGLLYFLFWWSN